MSDEPLHEIHRQLIEVGVCRPGSLRELHPRVRDRDDVAALRCSESDVVVLSRIDHMDIDYYESKTHDALEALGARERVVAGLGTDTRRRVDEWGDVVANRRWLDMGTGAGAVLDAMGDRAAQVVAVEPHDGFRTSLAAAGYTVHRDIRDVPSESVDVATLFHVFEHLTDPLGTLGEIRRVLGPSGRVVIEVPHARDMLLDFLGSTEFREFTLWSEHLVLHTRDSLRRLIAAAGLQVVTIEGVQRYPLANHLHWLARGRPGGHDVWAQLRDEDLDHAYESMLGRMDATDTLVATACRAPG